MSTTGIWPSSYELTTVVAVTVVLALISGVVFFQLQERRVTLQQIGSDPGFLGRNLTAARRRFSKDGYKLLQEAYEKSPTSNYVVQTEDMSRIVISPHFIEEIDMLPETTLSHRESIVRRHIGHYTGMAIVTQSHLHADICRVHLRRNLPRLIPGMSSHLDEAISEFLHKADDQDFTPVPAMGYSFFVVARIFAYVFMGEPLCREKEWMQAIGEYPKIMISLAGALRPWSAWARPIIAPFLKEAKKLTEYQDKLIGFFKAEIESRRKDGNHSDALQWIVNLSAPHEADDRSIVLKLMFLALAAIHTSAVSIDHMILDLCERPEYIEQLRSEISTALSSTQGTWTTESLSRLPKLDSFMQESRRWNHPAALAMHRLALKDVTLSDGTVIPKGYMMSIPAEALCTDPEYYSDPHVFDGWRFLSDKKVASSENGFAQILPGNLSWGHGRSTCPGRWYADAQIKLTLAKTIQQYEIRFPNGTKERPANIHDGERISPDPKAMIEMRRRT